MHLQRKLPHLQRKNSTFVNCISLLYGCQHGVLYHNFFSSFFDYPSQTFIESVWFNANAAKILVEVDLHNFCFKSVKLAFRTGNFYLNF